MLRMPAKAASVPISVKAQILTALTLMPETRAALALPPTAKTRNPKLVRDRSTQPRAATITKNTSCIGMMPNR